MNACLVAYTFYEIDYRVRRYAEALVEQGDRVDVISLRRNGQAPKGVLNGVTIHRIQKRSYNEKNILDYAIKILSFFFKGSFILLRLHFKYGYRVIHVHSVPDFLVFMALIPKLLGASVILDIHDILPEFYCEKFGKNMDSMLARVMLLVEKVSTRFADHVIAANDLWRDKIISRDKISSEDCTSLINYPKLGLFGKSVSKAKDGELKIIYPGTISHHHGLDIAIRALNIVKREIPSVTLEVYTRSNNIGYYRFLQSLIDDLGVRENVRFFDPVPLEELIKILPSAQMGIVPKRGGVFADEAMSTKILDYMAAGLPVITSRTKIDEHYFDDSMVMFYEPENYESLAKCIVELHKNPQERRYLVDNSKRFIAQNNWELKREAYYRIVENLTKIKLKKPNIFLRKIYLLVKPVIPRKLQIKLRGEIVLRKRVKYKELWPVCAKAAKPPTGWPGWPGGKKFAVVLTHDVETAKGRDRCVELSALEEQIGLRSSFNFVPKGYEVPRELRNYLIEHGFEVGVHGLYHDKNPFESKSIFDKQASQINRYMEEWGCVGFRSPCMYRNLEWIGELNIEYDSSSFDTDPFEPQPDGMETIFPFWVPSNNPSNSSREMRPAPCSVEATASGSLFHRDPSNPINSSNPELVTCNLQPATVSQRGYVELPYTLPQDFTLFVLMREKDISIWKQKLDWIVENGGMALVITHPDYICFDGKRTVEEYPLRYYEDFLEYIKRKYEGQYWHVLPKDISKFWRNKFSVTEERISCNQCWPRKG